MEKFCCPSVNLSMNRLCYYSGIACRSYFDSNSITCSLSYSTSADNYAAGYTCISFHTGGANNEIKSCNILRNTQGTLSSEGTIWASGNLKIEDSCILENNANYNFFVSSSSYTVTLSNCTVDRTTCNQNLVTQNTVTKSFILALNHMSTRNCNSKYDAVEMLNPTIHIPSASKKFLYQLSQRNLVLLHSVFYLSFIHPYPFCDSLC
jgi:hypothetical protein